MTTELIIPIKVETKDLFTTTGVDAILKAVDDKITEFDITSTETKKDRDKIISFASKITKTKTFLEKTGKDFVADKKAAIKIFDTSRKLLRESLTERADRARKPVSDWETADKLRIEKERLEIEKDMDHEEAIGMEDLFNREKEMARKEAEMAKLEEDRLAKEEAEQAEKERIENEARIKKEAEEQATKDAEIKIIAEREAKEKAELELKHAEENAKQDKLQAIEDAKEAEAQAERDRITAEEKAESDQKEAVQKAKDDAKIAADQKERERLIDEKLDKEETDRKAANKKHQASVNNKILSSFFVLGWTEVEAKAIIKAVATGKIPFMQINY